MDLIKKQFTAYLDINTYHHPAYSFFSKVNINGIEFCNKSNITLDTYEYAKSVLGTTKCSLKQPPIVKKIKQTIKNIFAIPTLKKLNLKSDVNLIQGTNSFLYLNKIPWATDTDIVSSFYRHSDLEIGISITKRIIKNLLRRDTCIAILPWTYAALKSIESFFNNDKMILKKAHVLYPATIPAIDKSVNKPDKSFKFLFIGRLFYEKGGNEILNAFSYVCKKIDCELHVVSQVPNEIKNKFKNYRNIIFYDFPLSPHKINALYRNSHCLLLPSYFDTYGYTIIEAKSYGIPTIGSDVFALPELIENEISGIIIHSPISYYDKTFLRNKSVFKSFDMIAELVKKHPTEILINELKQEMLKIAESSNYWLKLSKNCISEVTNGKFSIPALEKRLLKAYEPILTK